MNMNSEHFIYFARAHEVFRNNPDKTLKFNAEGTADKTAQKFNDNIKAGIEDAKVFDINENVKKLLCLTKTPNKNDEFKLPFDSVFLDIRFTQNELKHLGIDVDTEEIKGVLIKEGHLVGEDGTEYGKDLNITMLSTQRDGEIWFDNFNKNNNLYDEFKDIKVNIKENPTTDKKARDFIHKFVLNFLNFINNPEVTYVLSRRSEKNKMLRRKRNQIVIDATASIQVRGELKIYIDNLSSQTEFEYSHRFWVRGHFRELRSDRYNEKKRIWVLPYIKGKGVLIDRHYHISQ